MTKQHFSPITFFLIALVVFLAVLLLRQEANSQNAEANPTTTDNANSAPSGIYLSYQGQALDNAGTPLNATVPMTFELFDTLTGGTACHSEAHNIDVTDGIFGVTLGQTTAIPDDCLINDIYLQLTINGETLTPREQLTPFANTLPKDTVTRGNLYIDGILLSNGSNGGHLEARNPSGDPSSVHLSWLNDVARIRVGGDGAGANNGLDIQAVGNRSLMRIDNGGNVSLSSGSGSMNIGGISYGDSGSGMDIMPGQNENLYIKTQGASGTVYVGGNGGLVNLNVSGNLSVGGSCTASLTDGDELALSECSGGSITTGAVIEANLQTQAEMRSERIERFEQGDLLCWSTQAERLELCATANDRLVMAVADKNGKPIVMGAEPIKVIGPVQAGDILVTSAVAGYATVNNNPAPGTVIGQALEDFDGEHGLIKAMIRKW